MPVLAHWNGSNWTAVASPAARPSELLFAVTRFPGGYWAVGEDGTPLILRISGSTVRRMPVPVSAPSRLSGVAATSATNAWAVGNISNGPPLIMHWNGTAWRRTPLRSHLATGSFRAVAATSATNAWAVAGAEIVHWNGTSWSRVPGPAIAGQTYSLSGVAATSAKNAWAVGTTSRTLILHWNGTRWTRVRSPNPTPGVTGEGLSAAAGRSADNAWAVGWVARD